MYTGTQRVLGQMFNNRGSQIGIEQGRVILLSKYHCSDRVSISIHYMVFVFFVDYM